MSERHPVRTVQHDFDFAAAPDVVYEALMDAEKHAAFTGYSAEISREVGGTFVTCGGRNSGRNLVLRPGRRIVQAWTHRDWPEDHMSIATFDLEPTAKGTRLTFTQTGVPESALAWIDGGWPSTYWEALARHLAS
jgi:activator of HSP90 ATPase